MKSMILLVSLFAIAMTALAVDVSPCPSYLFGGIF